MYGSLYELPVHQAAFAVIAVKLFVWPCGHQSWDHLADVNLVLWEPWEPFHSEGCRACSKRAALFCSVYQSALAVWPTQFNHMQHFLEARLKLASLKGRWTVTPVQPIWWRLADWIHFSIRSKSSMMLKSGSVKYTHKGSSVVLDSNTS